VLPDAGSCPDKHNKTRMEAKGVRPCLLTFIHDHEQSFVGRENPESNMKARFTMLWIGEIDLRPFT
ncbi:MAG: hypothetical protein WEB60_10075, partial [Terrimicrobiaceae bacterium]